ncbi:hypothetical protein KPL74_10310 [Bacillus sp. NP157]|nr:hypothetical protein KPL74_10310 [Bacillus sp. NP157]
MDSRRVAWFVVLVTFLGGCASPPVRTHATAAFEEDGPTVLEHLQSRYDDVGTCDGANPNAPAFVCNGIMLRGVDASPNYHSWDVNPGSAKFPGVSFSYLRRDAPLLRLAYTYRAGLIFYPDYYAHRDGFDSPEVLCAFPIDGDTDSRADKGCGPSGGIATSGPCQPQGITTATAWLRHFTEVAGGVYKRQCSFTVARHAGESAAIFREVIKAEAILDLKQHDSKPNELVLDGWAPGRDDKVPLEALFYLGSSPPGLATAQFIQKDFKATAGRWVPIIRLTLPTVQAGAASFDYQPGDQAVSGP